MLSIRRVVVIGTAVVAGLVGPGMAAGPAFAKTGCGAVIKADTTLKADVGPCPGVGLVVAASNVTVELGGHRVFGTRAEGSSPGILLDHVSGVTVKNGSVDNFDAGILVFRGQKNTLARLNVHDNDSAQFVADHPDLAQLGDGIAILSSSFNTLTADDVHDNGPFSGIAILTETGPKGVSGPLPTGNLITGNVVRHNDVDDVCTSAGDFFGGPCQPGEGVFSEDIGVRVEGPGATNTVISGNTVAENGREGVSVLNTRERSTPPGINSPQNTDTLIAGNDINHNGVARVLTDPEVGQLGGDGIFNRCFNGSFVPGCPTRTTIVGNQVNNNQNHGIAIGKSQGNTIVGNTALGNGGGTTTDYASDPPYTDGFDENVDPPCDANVWLNNVFGTVNQPCVRHHPVPAAGSPSPLAAVASPTAEADHHGPQPPRPGGRATL
ncbi:MAG: hypothetical protein V7605_1953 [Acidimicrobiaceae bacterium]